MATTPYAEDLTGSLPANLIQNEEYPLSFDAGRGFHYIVPKNGPFFVDDLKVFLLTPAGTQEWKINVNFYLGGKYQTLSLATAKSIWGAIVFPNLTGDARFLLQYRTVGGQHMVTETELLKNVANIVKNPRGLTWEMITGKPNYGFPVEHPFDYDDVQGQKEVVEGLLQIANNVLGRASQQNSLVDIRDLTKSHVGMEKTPNMGLATIETFNNENLPNDLFMTPLMTFLYLQRLGLLDAAQTIAQFKDHMSKPGLGHDFSRRDLGLGNVPDLPLASDDSVVRGLPQEELFTLRQLEIWLRLHGPSLGIGTTKHKAGKVLASYCKADTHRWEMVADGDGGTMERIRKEFDPTCGAFLDIKIVFPVKGTPYKTYCTNGNLMNLISGGDGTAFPELLELSSRQCVGNLFAEAGFVLSSTCSGKTETRLLADGKGGVITQTVENSAKCLATVPPAGQFIRNDCAADFTLTVVETNGEGGERIRSVTPKSPTCGYREPTTPTNNNPEPGTVVGNRCENGKYLELVADGTGGNWPRELPSKNYTCPQPTTTSSSTSTSSTTTSRNTQPTVGSINWTTTHTSIYINDTETQRVTGSGWPPNMLVTLRIMNESTAWGQPYERQLDTRQVRTDSNGNFTYTLQATETGITPLGVYRSWWQIGDTKSNSITRSFFGRR